METSIHTDHAAPAASGARAAETVGRALPVSLHSLAELGQMLAWLDPPCPDDVTPDPLALDDLLTRLASAEDDLGAAITADADARRDAKDLLDRYERVRADARRAEDVLGRTQTLLARATNLRNSAFTSTAQQAAQSALVTAEWIVTEVAREHERARAEEITMENHPEVRRLVAERDIRDAAIRQEGERTECRARILGAVEEAQVLADQQRLDKACELLEPLLRAFPSEQPLRALHERLAERARLLRMASAHALLWDIRRHLRPRPAEVLVAIEEIDFARLDEDLARQLFGEWLRAARHLDLPGAVRHSPELHRGALLVPHGTDGTLVVVSSVGGSPLTKGQVIHRGDLRGLRLVTGEPL
jgi:hypothetical protein